MKTDLYNQDNEISIPPIYEMDVSAREMRRRKYKQLFEEQVKSLDSPFRQVIHAIADDPRTFNIWKLYYIDNISQADIAQYYERSRSYVSTLISACEMFLDGDNISGDYGAGAIETYNIIKNKVQTQFKDVESILLEEIQDSLKILDIERSKYEYDGELPPPAELEIGKERWPIWRMIKAVYKEKPNEIKRLKRDLPLAFEVLEAFYGIHGEYLPLKHFQNDNDVTKTRQAVWLNKKTALQHIQRLYAQLHPEAVIEG